MDEKFDYLNIALEVTRRLHASNCRSCVPSCEAFVAELKAQGIFDAVTMVSSSDFGRTLTSNGKASWGQRAQHITASKQKHLDKRRVPSAEAERSQLTSVQGTDHGWAGNHFVLGGLCTSSV